MSSFGTYLVGFIILIVGLAIAAYLLGVSSTWILVGAIILIGDRCGVGHDPRKDEGPAGSSFGLR